MVDYQSIPIYRDNKSCHFCSYNAVENGAHFMLECPLYNSIGDKFPSIFKNLAFLEAQVFLQQDHEVDISLYLTEDSATLENQPVWNHHDVVLVP